MKKKKVDDEKIKVKDGSNEPKDEPKDWTVFSEGKRPLPKIQGT